MRGLFNLLRTGVFYNRSKLYVRKGARDSLLNQHKALYDAIMEGDPDAAQNAAYTHLDYVLEFLHEFGRAEVREDVSRRRLKRFKQG